MYDYVTISLIAGSHIHHCQHILGIFTTLHQRLLPYDSRDSVDFHAVRIPDLPI